MAKGQKRAVLYRAVKFEIVPTSAQLAILLLLSENLRRVWNEAHRARMEALLKWRIAKEFLMEDTVKFPTLFDQINALTSARSDEGFAYSPRNWQEETLDRLNGSFLSFFTLMKNGDRDAKQPRARGDGFFQVIPGRSGFTVKDGKVHFAPNRFGRDVLSFLIPSYCQGKLADGKVKKFVISRSVADLSKEGRYFISIVYELPQPEVTQASKDELVYLALGASAIGVLCANEAFVLDLWRPDKHWKPKIECVERRLRNPLLKKGSKRWLRLNEARKRMNELMSRQQRQNHREVVAKLVRRSTKDGEIAGIGKHFVVTDYVVRSKPGKLADGEAVERGGSQGLNWAAQNTGSFLDLLMHLEEKVKEVGGTVTRHKICKPPPRSFGQGRENKIEMARWLREDFLEKTSR